MKRRRRTQSSSSSAAAAANPNGIEAPQSSSQSVPMLTTAIFFEILTRLPVESVLRCRSVCKLWRSLISDSHFVKSHLTLSTRNNHPDLIICNKRRMFRITCYLHDDYDHSVSYSKFEYPFNRRETVWIVGSCNGLLCISTDEGSALFIWNPSTRKLNDISFDKMGCAFTLHYGFGYDESSDDYKVVVVSVKEIGGSKFETLVKIYSLRNGSWKDFGDFSRGMPLDIFANFSNGALHWSANKAIGCDHSAMYLNGDERLPFKWAIISLDLATETYGEVLQPVYDEGDKDMTIGSLREWLCVLCNYHGNRADLWVMKVYGVKDSWTKLVSIPYMTDPEMDRFWMPLCISNDGKNLLQADWGSKLLVYDSKNKSFTEKYTFDEYVEVSTFVESLVSPMPATGLGDGF